MEIRRAKIEDISDLNRLLAQVNLVHHDGRPDIFKPANKYTDDELKIIIEDDSRPILVADDNGMVVGYAYCIYQQHSNDNLLTDVKTLYIDDLCVDENKRGGHIGKKLYNAVLDLAKDTDCYNVTLNVWNFNEGAMKFYQSLGLTPLKTTMEQLL